MLTIIGDVHGKFDKYLSIVNKSEHSVCLGDFGLSETWNKLYYSTLNPCNHMVVSGNHDCYDTCINSPHYLGDYGSKEIGGVKFFFVRGGISIDRVYRVGEELSGGSKTWWSQEELNFQQCLDCISLYEKIKPDIVLSHAPAAEMIPILHRKNDLTRWKFHKGFVENTSILLSHLFKIHPPKLAVSAHHHISLVHKTEKTTYKCLDELEVFRIH